jgi:glucan phosphoethanolaminetransferase (alkaline phosphatase superfamily)
MRFDLGPYDQYYLAAVVLIGTYCAAFTLLWLSQRSRYADFIKSFRGIAQNFLTVINVIFALNLAFLANDTWNARDQALSAVYRESGSLMNILDFAKNLPETTKSHVIQAVETYAHLTVTTEWPRLARRESSREVSQHLDALMGIVSGSDVSSAVDSSVAAQLLQQAVDVRSMRDLRIALSLTHVNPLKWLGMVFLGFLTMISIVMVHVDQRRAQLMAVLLFATASAPTAAIILIHGNPFQDPLAVSPAPLVDIARPEPNAGS